MRNPENKNYRKLLPTLKLEELKEEIILVDLRKQGWQESLETWNRWCLRGYPSKNWQHGEGSYHGGEGPGRTGTREKKMPLRSFNKRRYAGSTGAATLSRERGKRYSAFSPSPVVQGPISATHLAKPNQKQGCLGNMVCQGQALRNRVKKGGEWIWEKTCRQLAQRLCMCKNLVSYHCRVRIKLVNALFLS